MRASKRIKNDLLYGAMVAVITLARLLPRRAAVGLLGVIGHACFYAIGDARRTVLRNLERALGGDTGPEERRALAKRVFGDAGRNLADIFRLRGIRNFEQIGRIVSIEGEEHLRAAYGRGRGVVCVTGHIGAFELLAAYVSLRGYPVTVVGTELYDPRLDALLVRNRERTGVTSVHRGRDTLKLFRALKKGGVLGILIDQDTKVESVFVPFFGRPAATPVGAAVLALRTGAAVVPIAISRGTDGRHVVRVRPELPLPDTGDRDADAAALTAAMTNELEGFIRRAPSQWVWMHRRWRRKPREAA